MTDYAIQKATADKYGVVPSPDNIFGCRKAILEKLGGDSTNANTIYECDKRILPLVGGASATLQEKSVTITENGTTAINPDTGYDGMSKLNVTTNVPVKEEVGGVGEYTENGTYNKTPPEGKTYGLVTIHINVPTTKTQETTQASYDFLETKDPNTIYLITD